MTHEHESTNGKRADSGSPVGPFLRSWQWLYRGIPNVRGKGKVLFDWPSRFIQNWPTDVAIHSLEGCIFLHGNLNDFLYRHLFFFGLHEVDVDWMCRRLLLPGDVFVDIGACYGYHALTAAQRVGSRGKVFGIEPQPGVFEILKENARKNEITNIEIDNIALSNHAENLQLQTFADLDIGHASAAQLEHPVSEVHTCPAITLDEYIFAKSIKTVRVVKLDVEGAELKILQGSSTLLGGSTPPLWIIEVNLETSAACGYHPRDLLTLLSAFGYQAYRPVWGQAVREIRRMELCPAAEIQHGQNLLCAIASVHADSLSRVGLV